MGRETAMGGVVRQPDARCAAADHPQAERNEGGDRDDLDRREQIFDRAERPYADEIDGEQREAEPADPPGAGDVGQPVAHVDGDRSHLRPDRQDDAGDVGVADEETGEAAEHRRPGELDREAAAQEQPGADRPADRDHRQLARPKRALEGFFGTLRKSRVPGGAGPPPLPAPHQDTVWVVGRGSGPVIAFALADQQAGERRRHQVG
ncbi:hypothetical protein WR25_12464 [Diploscapter pachys]|uniref:Uncharacterized protein n=1 Tax=Diploscapter pachys TaxID=2018661 RepID=A0A2A2K7D2_9BILA|nr:hypothetical protein WR25_12464 [Diploscapter pachys]